MPLPKLEGFKGPNRQMVYGIEGLTWTVKHDVNSTSIYLLHCSDSQIIVPGKTNKVCQLRKSNKVCQLRKTNKVC